MKQFFDFDLGRISIYLGWIDDDPISWIPSIFRGHMDNEQQAAYFSHWGWFMVHWLRFELGIVENYIRQ